MVTYAWCDIQFKEKSTNGNDGFHSRTLGKNTLNTFLFAYERFKAVFGEHVKSDLLCVECGIF